MKISFKKILLALTLVLVLTAALAVAAVAATNANDPITSHGTVTFLAMDDTTGGVIKSGYSDIDGNADWVQVGGYSNGTKSLAYEDANYYWTNYSNIYFNESTKTLVAVGDNKWGAATFSSRTGAYPRADIKKGDTNAPNAPEEILNDDSYFYISGSNYYFRVHGIEPWIKANADKIEHFEFRADTDGKYSYACVSHEFVAVMGGLKYLTDVKYSSSITFRANTYNEIFDYKADLTTVKYGTFNADGSFDTDCRDGVVSICQGDWVDNVSYTSYPSSGVFGVSFRDCKSITAIEYKDAATLNDYGFVKNTFRGCTNLRSIYMPASVDYTTFKTTAADIFKDCNNATVYVADPSSVTCFDSFTNVELGSHEQYIIDCFANEKMLTADGVSIKIKDSETASGTNVAARFLFSLDAAKALSFAKTQGLMPEEVGVIACAATKFTPVLEAVGGNETYAVVQLLTMADSPAIHNQVITVNPDGSLSYPGKFLPGTNAEKGEFHYSYTLYGIPEKNYTSEIYAATYIKTTDGKYIVVSYNYDSVSGVKNTMSLYDATLGLFAKGQINSEKVEDKYLWDILKTQIVDLDTSTPDVLDGDSTTNTGKAVDYYFLPNYISGKEVLVFKRGANVEAKGTSEIPHRNEYDHPKAKYPEKYAAVGNIIIDYGVDSVRRTGLADAKAVTAIAYPYGLESNSADYLFYNDAVLADVYCCKYNEKGESIPHMSDIYWGEGAENTDHLFDLRGIVNGVVLNRLVDGCWAATNVVAGKFIQSSGGNPGPFTTYPSVKSPYMRFWSTENYGKTEDGKDIAPANYTIDLRSSGVEATEISAMQTGIAANGYHLWIPESVVSVLSTGTIRLVRSKQAITVHATAEFKTAFEAYMKNLTGDNADLARQYHSEITWEIYPAQ